MKNNNILLAYDQVIRWMFMFLFFIGIDTHAAPKSSDVPEFLYSECYRFDDVASILEKYDQGKFTTELSPQKFFPGTSVWIYLPKNYLLKDTSRKFLLTGYQDEVEAYSIEKGNFRQFAIAGKYIGKSEVTEKTGKYYVQLYTDIDDVQGGILIVYRRYQDIAHTELQIPLANKAEVLQWKEARHSAGTWMNVIWCVYAGMLFFSLFFMLVRYFITRELPYLFYGLWVITFSIHYVFFYFLSLSYLEEASRGFTRFTLIVAQSSIVWAIPFLTLTFRSFHYSELDKKIYKEDYSKIVFRLNIFCVVVSILVIIINYFTSAYFLGTIIVQAAVICFLLFLLFYGRKRRMTTKEGYAIFFKGGIIHIFCYVLGAVFVLIDSLLNWKSGVENIMTVASLSGFVVHNFISFMALKMRDQEIFQERNMLYAQSVENELKVIQNSLNPHFIFNSLGLINSMILKNEGTKARATLYDFSHLLRMVIDKSTEQFISLEDEVKMVQLFLGIEKNKSPGLFDFQIEIQEGLDVRNYKVPPLILQPIVENAIKHGMMNRTERSGGKIIVRIGRTEDKILFEVDDNGIGYQKTIGSHPPEYYTRKHIGIEFTQKRIALITNTNYTGGEISIIDKSCATDNTEEQGTIFKFTVPLII